MINTCMYCWVLPQIELLSVLICFIPDKLNYVFFCFLVILLVLFFYEKYMYVTELLFLFIDTT